MADTLLGNLVPLTLDAVDSGLTVATRIRFAADRRINKVRWYFPPTLPSNTVPWAIWVYNPADDTAGALLGTGSFSASPTPNAWNEVSIAPIDRADGDEIVVAVWTATRYNATLNFFGADVPSAGGFLIGSEETASNRRNGRFRSGGSLLYPSSGSNKSCYFVDIEVDEIPGALEGTFQASAGAAALSGAGALLDLGALELSVAASTVAAEGLVIANGAMAMGLSGFSLIAGGGLTVDGTVQLEQGFPDMALTDGSLVFTGFADTRTRPSRIATSTRSARTETGGG